MLYTIRKTIINNNILLFYIILVNSYYYNTILPDISLSSYCRPVYGKKKLKRYPNILKNS